MAQAIIICELSFWVTGGDEFSGTAMSDGVWTVLGLFGPLKDYTQ